jgi:DNA uptake protein ComE-like DNA-binding protein
LLFLIPAFLKYHRKPTKQDVSAFRSEISAFEKSLKDQENIASKSDQKQIDFEHVDYSVAEQELTLFPFNPNEMTAEDWKKLGLKDWQVKIVTNYTSKGGKFYKKEDFSKIYGISKAQYEVLAPFIDIPAREKTSKESEYPAYTPKAVKIELVDLNKADSAMLVTLNGIGPSFAKRIIKFRKQLGGFYSVSQLLEVYGLDSTRFEKIYKYCVADPADIAKINVNKVTTDDLRKHPYFDYYLAKAIVDRRIIEGKYTSVDQVSQIPLVHAALYEKIKYYLTTE